MSQDPNAGGAPNGVAPTQESAQPQATGAANPDLSKIDLTSLPQFREYQSSQARKQAELDRKLRETQALLEQQQRAQQQAQFANLDKLDPEERAEAYRRQLEQVQQVQQAQAAKNQLIARGSRLIQNAGLQFNDPRLADIVAADPSPESYDALVERVNAIVVQDRDAAALAARKAQEDAAAKTQAQVQQATQQAKVDALNAAGVTVTSSATPTVTPTANEKDKKIAAIIEARKAIRHKGIDSSEYRDWMQKFRASGLTWADLGN